ncbi:MAG: hypothetical protein R2883_03945 [Caldisericia bacterium]
MKKVFFIPGFIGSIVALIIVLVLIARKWFENPGISLSWLDCNGFKCLDFAILYGLVIGDEKVLFSGGLK